MVDISLTTVRSLNTELGRVVHRLL
jgi:hypothetical protein